MKGLPGKETDEELIERAKQGDRYAFDLLVKKYQKKIYYLAYRMTKEHDSADDLAQETFVKAYFSIRSFKSGYNFYTWIYRICMNLSINYLKKQKTLVSEDRYDLEQQAVESDPLSDLTKEEKRIEIEKAIDNLPKEFKAVFVLKAFEDLSYEEIAKTLGISKGTVMSRLFRARERLKKSLERYFVERE